MLERRALLQIGGSSFLGLGLSNLLTDQVNASNTPQHRAKSVILVFLTGGGPHIDMFDPKPESPEIKGDYQPIDTSIAGIRFTDRMPQMAKRVGKLAVLRSLSHGDNRHLSGSHNTLTGAVQPFRGSSNQDKSLNRAPNARFPGSLLRKQALLRHLHAETSQFRDLPPIMGLYCHSMCTRFALVARNIGK